MSDITNLILSAARTLLVAIFRNQLASFGDGLVERRKHILSLILAVVSFGLPIFGIFYTYLNLPLNKLWTLFIVINCGFLVYFSLSFKLRKPPTYILNYIDDINSRIRIMETNILIENKIAMLQNDIRKEQLEGLDSSKKIEKIERLKKLKSGAMKSFTADKKSM